MNVSATVEGQKEAVRSAFHSNDHLSSLVLSTGMRTVNCFSSRRLISRFRCGSHGLSVDTGSFGQSAQKLARQDRVCHVCRLLSVEDEQHLLFDCPAHEPCLQSFSKTPCAPYFFFQSATPLFWGHIVRPAFHMGSLCYSMAVVVCWSTHHQDIYCNLQASFYTPKLSSFIVHALIVCWTQEHWKIDWLIDDCSNQLGTLLVIGDCTACSNVQNACMSIDLCLKL